MATYEVLETSFINGKLVGPGDTVEFDGTPGRNLKPIDGTAKKAVKELPPDNVARLVTAVRLSAAATRGASPGEVNEQDVVTTLADMEPKPPQATIDAALKELGLEDNKPLV